MKKIIAITLVFAMCFSLFGCNAQNDEEDTAKPLEILQNEAENQTENKNENPQPEPEPEPELNIDMETPFREGEVVVTLTKEQSAKKLKYTPEYFKSIDAFNVFEFDYFPEKYHPEYKGMTTLIVMFNSPSKENVIEAIKTLKKDERVYDAVPNYMMTEYDFTKQDGYGYQYYVVLTEEETYKNLKYTPEDFAEYNVEYLNDRKIDVYVNQNRRFLNEQRRVLEVDFKENTLDNAKKILSDERIEHIVPNYLDIDITHLDVVSNSSKIEYTSKDFPDIECQPNYIYKDDIYRDENEKLLYFNLELKNPSYYEIYRAYNILKNCTEFNSVTLSVYSIVIGGNKEVEFYPNGELKYIEKNVYPEGE